MATVALSIILAPIPGGAFVGALLGSMIDNYLLFPAIFGTNDAKPPRIDDMRLMNATDGTPMHKPWGPENRLAGTTIWVGSEVLEKQEADTGGSGGGSQTVGYDVYLDCAVGVCEGTISKFKRIWADGALIYREPVDVSVVSDELEVQTPDNVMFGTIMRIKTGPTGPDLTQFHTGKFVDVSGFGTAANNGTFKVRRAKRDTGGGTSVFLINSNAVAEAAGNTVTLEQTVPAFDVTAFDDVTFYLGTDTQTADPIIESHEGAGNVPGYRDTAYAVFSRLHLSRFGNRIPQLNFLVEQQSPMTVEQLLDALLSRAASLSPLTSSHWTISGLDGDFIQGYSTSGPVQTAATLDAPMLAYDVTVRRSNMALIFTKRGSETEVAIDKDDLAAHEQGTEPPRPLKITDPPDASLPSEVIASFIDARVDHQQTTKRVRRLNNIAHSIFSIQIPMVLTPREGKIVATRALHRAWQDRLLGEIRLPPDHIHVEEGDILPVENDDGETYRLLVTELARGVNYIVEAKGVLYDPAAADIDVDVEDEPEIGNDDLYIPPDLTLIPMDIPSLLDTHTTQTGFYLALCASEFEATFGGATILYSSDGGANYDFQIPVSHEAAIVECLTTLGTANGYAWDEENTLDVECLHGTLSSATEAQVLAGNNWMRLSNGEIVGFRTATALTETNTYRLQGLLRGLRGTEDHIGTHVAGELGVRLVAGGSILWEDMNVGRIGDTIWFKAVPEGEDPDNVIAQTKQMNAQTMRSFGVWAVAGSRNVDEDLTVTWHRRSRSVTRIFSGEEVPLPEVTEQYEIDVLDSPGGSVLNTYSVAESSWTYTAAQQTADGLTPGDSVDIEIYQLDPVVGRGNTKAATV